MTGSVTARLTRRYPEPESASAAVAAALLPPLSVALWQVCLPAAVEGGQGGQGGQGVQGQKIRGRMGER